jgi:hypothetical protein
LQNGTIFAIMIHSTSLLPYIQELSSSLIIKLCSLLHTLAFLLLAACPYICANIY